MPPRAAVLGHGPVGREEAPGVTRGLKPLHAPLPLAGGLVRVFCPIAEVAVLSMLGLQALSPENLR
jgi:hypothetical protein